MEPKNTTNKLRQDTRNYVVSLVAYNYVFSQKSKKKRNIITVYYKGTYSHSMRVIGGKITNGKYNKGDDVTYWNDVTDYDMYTI